MQTAKKKLTILLDANVYDGLHTKIGRGEIGSFINTIVKRHVVDNLESGYKAMAADTTYQADADAWVEGLVEIPKTENTWRL